MLNIKHIGYQHKEGLSFDFNLKINNSDSLAIIGPSGSGKSTLLNLIAGFIKPNKGDIVFDKKNITNIPPKDRPINMLFQEHNLFPHLNVFDNIAIGIDPNLKISPMQKESIEYALKKVGLFGFNKRFPHQLSGGQKQRVAIARTIIRNKPILLLDEPFSFLDPPLRLEMLDLVKELQQENLFIMIMVTHDYSDALRICNKTCFIQNGSILHINDTKEFVATTKNPLIHTYIT